jgi:hypothetical protein
MSSRPYCYRCEKHAFLGGCQCRVPAFDKEGPGGVEAAIQEEKDIEAAWKSLPDFYAGQDWF